MQLELLQYIYITNRLYLQSKKLIYFLLVAQAYF